MNRFLIVSGYHNARQSPGVAWFHKVWAFNTLRYVPDAEVVIIATSPLWPFLAMKQAQWIWLDGDLGDCGTILQNRKPYFMPGGPAVWMAGMWLAYINECDFIFKEQDCLTFGPWVDELYRAIGAKSAIFGSAALHGISTSLFLVKHAFIPEFVLGYLNEGREDMPTRIAEKKVLRMENRLPERFCRYSFGYDTDRPFHVDDSIFSVQKLTPSEMTALQGCGLVSTAGMPENVKVFSNRP